MATVISQPNVTVNKLPALLPAGLEDQRILVVGQKLAAGSATGGTLQEDVSLSSVTGLYGQGSFLANALDGVFDVFTRSGSLKLPQVDVISLDDASGSAATAVIDVTEIGGATNVATEAGTITVIVGSEFLYSFDIDVIVGQAIDSGAGNVADAIADAINANLDVPVTAANLTGTVTLTCRHDGTIGNGITLKTKGLSDNGANFVLGNIAVDITSGFAGGATDPTAPDLDAIVGDKRYQTLTHPLEYGIVFSVTNFLDNRFNVDNDILNGTAVVKDTDTLSNLKISLALLNSESLDYLCDISVTLDNFKGSGLVDLDFVLSARTAALRALRFTEGANLTRISLAATTGLNDATGGIHIATLPYFNTPVFSVSPMDTGVGFSRTEIEELADAGGSVIGNNIVGNTVILGEIFTTYKTDSAGNPDSTWHFQNTVDAVSVSAEFIFNNLKKDFAQSRLTEGNLIDGFSMVNEAAFRGQLKIYYTSLSELVITPAGKEAVNFFMDNLDVIIDLVQGKITANADLPIVVQLREILVNLRTTFSI